MNTCDLILVKGTGFLSDVVEMVTDSPYAHVAGYVSNDKLIEANCFEKTCYVPVSMYESMYDVYTCNTLTDDQKNKIIEYATNQVGGHYDYMLILIELVRYLFHIMLPYKEPFKSSICSTLWCNAYRSVGVDLCPGIKYPSPKDISQSKLLTKLN